ncbi:TonB-dependent receptor plug domain-containing protein [Sandaracinobacteroides saxicola]|uniref:TonB-dependent receptor n=1 Tax=Sandaracinobacteroides saxicola TaxID=2759707 RepID=A0A7G5ILI4_9SPHN|nr:TonB-dependent receptor [Sandaracinobacteroides saxicola]QMW24226.1 TonB-dependent receptor [Sandaracinobacteroides saxicola]
MTFRHLMLASAATGLFTLPSFAQTSAAPAAEDSETIIVTGTRRVDRTVADSPVPIDVIGSEALRSSGFTETNRVLNQLVPSFNFPQPSITDGTDVIRPATLRGLSPDQTLVLINGKRRHTTALLNINGSVGRGSAAVDINLIPSIAIERVEVLRDGAAAQYGSDAIAGVINFQLSRKREGGSISVTYGQYETTMDGTRDVTGIARDAGGNPILQPNSTGSASFFQLTDTGKDRKASDGKTTTITGNIGLPIGAEGFVNISAEYRDRGATNRTAADPRRYYGLAGTPLDPKELTLNRFTHRYGDAKTEDVLVFVNAGLPVGEALELYAFGSYGHRDGESAAFYRLPNETRTATVIYPDGFLPLITTKLKDYSITGGVKGDVGPVKMDFSLGYARNEFDFLIKNTANASLGPNSPRNLDSGGLRYDQFTANLDLSYNIEGTSFESLTIAGGLEYRREGYQLRAGEPDSYRNGGALVGAINPLYAGTATGNTGAAIGAQGFPGIQPRIAGQDVTQRRTRDSFSAYGELDVDIADWWTVQLAGRYEKYSDFGDTFNGKAATSINLIDGIKLRAALSTGFRAPSLQQQFFAAQATNNVGGVLLETVTLPVDSPVAIALGARPLKAEKSTSYSMGVVFTPLPSLSLTIDYYNIDINNRIVVTENLQATRDAAGNPTGSDPGASIARILNNAGFNSVNAARFFINGIDTVTKGFDAVATWRTEIGDSSTLRLTAGFNYNETEINGRRANPGPLAQVPGVVLFGRQESLRIESGQPRTKLNLSADFEREWLGVTLRANRYGRTLGAGADPFLDVNMSAKWLSDLEVRVEPVTGLQLAVGANNLFDVYPDRVPAGRGVDPVTGAARNYGATAYVTPYSSFSPFGFNGRFLYARATYRF